MTRRRTIEGVALNSDSPAEITRYARDKNSDYVLFTDLVELREPATRSRDDTPDRVDWPRSFIGYRTQL